MTPQPHTAGLEVQFMRSVPAPGILFNVQVTKRDGTVFSTTDVFPDSVAAAQHGVDLANDPMARVSVTDARSNA